MNIIGSIEEQMLVAIDGAMIQNQDPELFHVGDVQDVSTRLQNVIRLEKFAVTAKLLATLNVLVRRCRLQIR